MPIPTRAGQPAQLDPEDDPDVVERHLGQQPLESRPAGDGPAATTLVLVDDGHAVCRPAQVRGAATEIVLQVGRLAVLMALLGAGLADVDDRQPLMVPGLDLAQAPDGGAGRRPRSRGARAAGPRVDLIGSHAAPPARPGAVAEPGSPSGRGP